MKRVLVKFVILVLCCGQADPAGLRLPEPPKQHAKWQPDPAIPTNILSAVETLFAHGFPDPRGCEYREIEVTVSGIWNASKVVARTRGWVLPEKHHETNRFAICWNGLIYPVREIFEPADLRAEVGTNLPSVRLTYNAEGEVGTVHFSEAQTTRVLLLLRIGETAAALKYWSADARMANNPYNQNGHDDPYLVLAGDWAWGMFDRTLCAHMRGDEALALATARELAKVQPEIEAECAKRGYKRQPDYGNSFGMPGQAKKPDKPYLDFLDQLPQILADLERRAKEGNHVDVARTGGLGRISDQKERIAALIRDLDDAQVPQMGQPGWPDLGGDAAVSALVVEGDAAVGPLIDCVERDKRLTRTVGFHRNFFRQRTVLTVNSAAWAAIRLILHASFQDITSLRAYWAKYGDVGIDERCYRILKDDSAGARWLEAVGYIMQPTNVIHSPGSWWTTMDTQSNAPVRMRGEALRAKSNPTVSELMARRALEVPAGKPNSYDLGVACEMGLHLAKWDPAAAGPVATTLARRCWDVMKYSDGHLGLQLTRLAMVRADGGDVHAFDEYAEWLKTTTPNQFGFQIMDYLAPLQRYPTNQILETVAESLFGNMNSAWSRYPWPNTGLSNPIESDLAKVHAFRRLLSLKLDDKTVCGSIEFHAPNNFSYEITNYMNGGGVVEIPETEDIINGTQAELRRCDWIAFSLSKAKQIPFFNPVAPVERRDQAIREAKIQMEK